MLHLPKLPLEAEPLTFNCCILTPFFLDGAKQGEPQLRPEAFVGLMHYWFRALNGHLSLNGLKETEGHFFGSTEGRGYFSLLPITESLLNDNFLLLPHKASRQDKGLKPGQDQKFTLKFTLHNTSQHELLESLFRLSSLLGGVGRRSRRGAGAFQFCKFKDQNEVLATIQNDIKIIWGSSQNKIDKPKLGEDCLMITFARTPTKDYPYLKAIYLGSNGWPDAETLRERISCQTHKTKEEVVKTFHKQVSPEAPNRKDLPNKAEEDGVNAYAGAMGSIFPRFASPVHVSIVQIGNRYYPIITVVSGRKLGDSPLDPQKHFIENLLNATPATK